MWQIQWKGGLINVIINSQLIIILELGLLKVKTRYFNEKEYKIMIFDNR